MKDSMINVWWNLASGRAIGHRLALMLLLAGGTSCEEVDVNSSDAVPRSEETTDGEPPEPPAGAEIVYYQTRSRDAEGTIVEYDEYGEFDAGIRDAVGRGYANGPWIYTEEASHLVNADGTVYQSYAIYRRENVDAAEIASMEPDWDDLDPILPSLAKHLQDGVESDQLNVMVKLRYPVNWDVPLLPDPGSMPVEDFANAVASRESALAAREEDFEGFAEPLRTISRKLEEK